MPLEVVNLSKQFDRSWAFRDISFDVGEGEILGIAGDSADTRTLLLKSIAGVEKASGSVLIDGRQVEAGSASGRGICMFPPGNGTFLRRIFASGEIVNSKLKFKDISDATDSGRSVILLDNGFSSMEQAEKESTFKQLRLLAAEKAISIVVANIAYRDILHLCDSVAVIGRGEIVAKGTPEGVYLDPGCVAAAEATGRHNLFEARRVTSSNAEMPEFQTIAGGHRLRTRAVKKSGLGAINRNLTLGIRPEHVSLSFGASFPEDNIVKAKVSDVRFLGETTLVKLDAAGLQLSSIVMRLVGLNVGDECMIALPPDRVQIFRN